MKDSLRLQMQMGHIAGHAGRQLVIEYRYGYENGWHCGCWHTSPEDAAKCLEDRGA